MLDELFGVGAMVIGHRFNDRQCVCVWAAPTPQTTKGLYVWIVPPRKPWRFFVFGRRRPANLGKVFCVWTATCCCRDPATTDTRPHSQSIARRAFLGLRERLPSRLNPTTALRWLQAGALSQDDIRARWLHVEARGLADRGPRIAGVISLPSSPVCCPIFLPM